MAMTCLTSRQQVAGERAFRAAWRPARTYIRAVISRAIADRPTIAPIRAADRCEGERDREHGSVLSDAHGLEVLDGLACSEVCQNGINFAGRSTDRRTILSLE